MRKGEPLSNQKHPDPRGDRLEPGAPTVEWVKHCIVHLLWNALTEVFGWMWLARVERTTGVPEWEILEGGATQGTLR